jgi:hypothetical protein
MKNNLFSLVLVLFTFLQTSYVVAQKMTTIYQNSAFSITKSTVHDGKATATAISNTEITSDYQSISEQQKGGTPTLRTWKLTENIADFPHFESDIPLANAMYNLSLEEVIKDIRPDSAFMAGKEWEGVWTRDISYSILLSLAIIKPENAKISLMRKVKNDIIIQDTGTGGSYPVSTDRMTWALAAWEVFAVTGDIAWLRKSYQIIQKSVAADLLLARDSRTNLFYGESSFLDWREQSYPTWMEPKDIYQSICLGTNAVHYQTYKILEKMANILGETSTEYADIADQIKYGINRFLWVESKKCYGQFLYGQAYPTLSPKSEALGEALCVLFDIAEERKEQVIANTPVLPYGVPCIYPQIPNIKPYHNNAVWAFVQAYWNWAAAKAQNEAAVTYGIAALYRQSALFLTNKENLVADNGNFEGTAINSDRQLWSVAGNLATVYRVFFGMDFREDKLIFTPFVPKQFDGVKTLKKFRYRHTTLDITLKGHGSKIRKVTLDGKEVKTAIIVGGLIGEHTLVIELDNNEITEQSINLKENQTSPEIPQPVLLGKRLVWKSQPIGTIYQILRNGTMFSQVAEASFDLPEKEKKYAEYQLKAIDQQGNESFLSQPLIFAPEEVPLSMTSMFPDDLLPELISLPSKEQRMVFTAAVRKSGKYVFELLYSNGMGPINTDNKCAIRSLFKGEEPIAPVIFPQRGENDWQSMGYTNPIILYLPAGSHQFTLLYLDHNENMNGKINEAIVQGGRLRKID